MKSFKEFFKYSVYLFYLCFCLPLFADVNIVSPASNHSRVWANKQVLVIEATDGEEIYYSFTGTDPLSSGFVYDEPVFLDMTGDVELRISTINKNKERTDYVLKYTVDETKVNKLKTLDERTFVKNMESSYIYSLNCGKELSIPDTFDYCITSISQDTSMEPGRIISVSSEATLERYASLVLRSETGDYWNYVVHLVPSVRGEYSKAAVPFEIEDWSKLKLVDNKYIYALDDQWWQGCGKTLQLDRSVPHVIRWQNVDYDSLNPVMSYTIPATPVVKSEILEDSTMVLTLEGDENYRFARNKGSMVAFPSAGLHEKIVVDAFQGENFSGLMPVDVYCQNVYQGKLYTFVQVNRKRPAVPEIVLSNASAVSREDILFSIKSKRDDDVIKYTVFGPHKLTLDELVSNSFASLKIKLDADSFNDYDGSTSRLSALEDSPVLYKIYAYALDKWDNVSDLACVDVIIDKCNYFVDSASDIYDADGTFKKPFKDLSQIEDVVNSNTYTVFNVFGKVDFADDKVCLKQNCMIKGYDKAEIVFSKNASVYLNGSSLSIENVLINSIDNESDDVSVLFNVDNGVLTIDSSELSFGRYHNASVVNAVKSNINIKKTGITVFANDYACCVNGNGAKINIEGSRLSSVAATNVNVSSRKSTVVLVDDVCTVSGVNSRIAEFFSSKASLSGNTFKSKSSGGATENVPLWADRSSSVTQSKNKTSGF